MRLNPEKIVRKLHENPWAVPCCLLTTLILAPRGGMAKQGPFYKRWAFPCLSTSRVKVLKPALGDYDIPVGKFTLRNA